MTRGQNPNDDAVMAVLAEADRPLSAYQVLAALRTTGIQSPPVVYRALERLERAGRVHRLEKLNAYFACDGHHAHDPVVFALCRACGRVDEWPADDLVATIEAKAAAAGFGLAERTIEVVGLCRTCRGAPGAPVAPAGPDSCSG